jgi:hypothetical protein
MDGMTNESSPSFKCRYCEKLFRKESTLAAHLCEQKRRWQQETETGVQFGLRAYLKFYETTQGSARLKSYEDFVNSPYYNAFVRYGRHLVAIRAVNSDSFTAWLLKNNKKLDHWCKDSLYEQWLLEYVRKESVQDALERGLGEMQNYADNNPDLADYRHYFMFGNVNRIMHHICSGRITPWTLFNCKTGVEFLDNLTGDQVEIIMPWIEPDVWQKRFHDYTADVEWAKHILAEAGL